MPRLHVDYTYYVEEYAGTSIDAAEWPTFAARAADQLDKYKRMYVVTAPESDSEAMAVCAMAEVLAYYADSDVGAGALSSASIGSVSVAYRAGDDAGGGAGKGQDAELYEAAQRYLYIYRGVC